MFDGIKRALMVNQPSKENLLNQIVFPYLNNNLVVWFNNNQSQYFVDQGYRGNATVFSIINKITSKEKIAETQVFEKKGSEKQFQKYKSFKFGGTPESHSISLLHKEASLKLSTENDLARLLRNPNPYQTQLEFREAMSGFFRLTGETFIYGVGPGEDSKNYGKYTELYVLPSHLVEIVQGTTFEPISGYRIRMGDTTITIQAEDVLHLKTWNPNWNINASQLRGMSPLAAGYKYLTKNESALFAQTKALQNEGAKGIVSPNHPDPKLWLNPTQVAETEQAMDRKLNGVHNTHKVAISGMPLQYTAIGLSPIALAIIESMNQDTNALCALWGIDPILLGQGAGTYTNAPDARKALVTDVVIPYLNLVDEGLNKWLASKFSKIDGKDYYIDSDTTIFSELQMDLKLIKEVYDTWHIEGNEYRAMLNLEAKPETAIHMIAAGMIPLKDAIANEDDTPIDPKGDY